ncbi:tail fiber protein [Photorhabdus laumondii]|nr:tail fiber protein [Photorhabdus laumondii]NDL36573.1 phage tail protein [Photorhabdus laumondii subsp. laumondii]
MAKNEFLTFGIAEGANVLSNEEYAALAARVNGFSAGVAKSRELNKAWRQSSIITHILADFIAKESGKDVLDDGNIDALKSNLALAIKNATPEVRDASLTQKGITQLTDKTGNSNTLAATQKLVSDVNDNANTKLAKNQNGADIPDKNAFVKNLGLSETVELAKNAVPSSRKINGKALSRDINITSQDIFDEPVTIHENADLNTYRTGGLYYQPSSAWAVTGKNYPRGAAGSLIVLRGGYTQRYCVIGSSESYIRGYYDSLGWSAWAKEYNSENPQPPDIPIGVPLPYPHRYTPPGYLTCNGQTFNKSVYPKLAEAYPAGRVPDLRGEFIRGWDDSRGVDPGRVCGTWQADCIPDHNHYKVASKQLVEDLVLTGDAGWYTSSGSSTRTRSLDQNTYTGGVTEAQVIANETRPRNIAFNYIVRAV